MAKLLGIQMYLMAMVNRWTICTDNPLFDKLCKLYGVLMESVAFLFLPYLGSKMMAHWHCPSVFNQICCYYYHHIIAVTIHTLWRKTTAKESLQRIIDYEKDGYNEEEQTCRDLYDHHVKINIWIHKYVMIVFTLIGCTVWYVLTILHAVNINNEECPLTPGSFYQIEYPYGGYLAIMTDLSIAFIFLIIHLVNRMYPVSLVLFELAQIKILAHKIGQVDERAGEVMKTKEVSFDEALNEVINDCIRRHQKVIGLMDLFKEATKEVMLIGFLSNALELTIFIVQIFTADSWYQSMRSVVLSPTDVLQLFSFFWFANEVFLESSTLANDIYNKINWADYGKPVRIKLMIMMMRTQKPLSFIGVYIGQVTLEKFKQIMKSCFSLVTFFQTMYQMH